MVLGGGHKGYSPEGGFGLSVVVDFGAGLADSDGFLGKILNMRSTVRAVTT
jgi:hypothetical protein